MSETEVTGLWGQKEERKEEQNQPNSVDVVINVWPWGGHIFTSCLNERWGNRGNPIAHAHILTQPMAAQDSLYTQ